MAMDEEIEYNDWFFLDAQKALRAYTKLAHAKRATYGRDGLLGEDYANHLRQRINDLEEMRLRRNAANPGKYPEVRPAHFKLPPSKQKSTTHGVQSRAGQSISAPSNKSNIGKSTGLFLLHEGLETNIFAILLDKFCENISLRALKQFSVAISVANQTDRAGLSPQDTDPGLAKAWALLQTKVQEIAMNHGFPIMSLGGGWIGINPNGSPPTWEQIDTTAHWLNDHRKDLDTELEFVPPPPQKIFKVYDYETHKYIKPTLAVFLKARDSAPAWPGTIEAGPEVALEILCNRLKLLRCLSCHKGGNGASARKRGDALKGDPGPLFLECQCPLDTSLTELWIVKVTGDDPDVPKPDDKDLDTAAADFSFNPVNLRIVKTAIVKASGLNTTTMFQPKAKRLTATIEWALTELEKCSQDQGDKNTIGHVSRVFAEAMQKIGDDNMVLD